MVGVNCPREPMGSETTIINQTGCCYLSRPIKESNYHILVCQASTVKMHIVGIALTGSAHGQSIDRNSNAAERTKYVFTFSYLLIVHQVKGLSSVEFLVYS